MEKYDISQLTEFPRFEQETSQGGISTFLNKLWKLPLFSPNESVDSQNKAISDGKQQRHVADDQNKQDIDDIKTETGSYAVEYEGRSLPNILQRISSLTALGSGGGTKYADTELARYWMPDDISRECYECAARFSTLRRRHHCRVCGQIFCSRCCSQRVPGQIFGCAGGLRVCNYCCNIVLSYLRENDMTGEIADLRTLQENLQVKFPDNKSEQISNKSRDNFMFASEQDERCELRSSPKEALQDVFRQLSFSLPTQQHRYRLVRYNGVWRGADVLQWIMENTNNKTRVQASAVCQSFVSAGYMECTSELTQFADYALYRPLASTQHEHEQPEECNRLVESVSSYCLDLNLDDSSARLIKAPKTDVKSSPSSEEETNHPILDQSEVNPEADASDNKVCRAISSSGCEHLRLLLRQCLAREALPPAWLSVLYPLCHQAADIIMPDIYGNDIDVRNYVQVKKVAGGSMRDSHVIHGVVMTKNVAHRGMPQQISNPTILLLDCSIAYQRVEGKLTSLEPVLLQEREYLVRCAARITALRPHVVLVRGSAARGVQDALRREGVALAVGARERALARAARCTGADRVTSVDARIHAPTLGTAHRFAVNNYSGKTLMILEGCANPHLGCCILLRGAPLAELVKVKKVVKFMLLAFYNWKVEKAFLGDIEAVLPEPGMEFDDDETNQTEKDDSIEPKKDEGDTKIDDDESKDGNSEVKNNNNGLGNNIDRSNDDKEFDLQRKNDLFYDPTTDANEKFKENMVTKMNESFSDAFSNPKCDRKLDETYKIKHTTDDTTQKTKLFVRKADSDKNLSCGVPIRDFSDPLRSTLSVDDDVFLPKDDAVLKADSQNDRWSTDDVVLSMSPNVVIPAPFLETEVGRKCPMREYYPRPLLAVPSRAHAPHTPRAYHRKISRPCQSDIVLKEVHPFISEPMRSSLEEGAVRASLAHYRATGCRLVHNNHTIGCPSYKPSVVKKLPKEEDSKESRDEASEADEPVDPLSPENHQKLNLLLYSYSHKSPNVPDFCVNPWTVTMEMYGRHDISLGGFLEKYCFNSEYKCPSANCQVPMNMHVRRFVHEDVCITITCNTIGHSNVDKLKEDNKQVMFWSRCERCSGAARASRLSRSALALSLAQYVRLRCSAPRYRRARCCDHALNAHAHAFVSGLTTAYFRYSKISTYDIELPPEMISINYDTKQMRDALINQLNDLVLKGHETFSNLTEGDAEKDYQTFKQHMDQIHLALTSTSLQEQNSLAAVVRSLWSVSDRIITGEKMLRDAQDKWSTPPAKTNRPQLESNVEDKSDLEDSVEVGGSDVSGSTYVFTADNPKDSDKEHTGEEDEERGDKKTVKQILSQLLSNNQPSNQSGMIISTGFIPVVVMAGEIGSVIAATLASVTYQRSLRAQRQSVNQAEQEDNENINASGKEKTEAEKPKAAKCNDHIEVLLKDGLLCRVYYASQFHRLRHALLPPLARNPHITDHFVHHDNRQPPDDCRCSCYDIKDKPENKSVCEIEEGFVRSLAQCVPWAARGGKSGSTFCKTKDDRYVLKEMTKPEWQQFLEFAPHYFNYLTNCHKSKLPSLLARILGVFSVGGSGSGVLVMENVWYACGGTRYDLKGSSRHRLAPDEGAGVLMDENLLLLRWERPLYVRQHTGAVLSACLQRDTAFLHLSSVMDYSLLLGLPDDRLVLGIIDYIRTFTWDKKLEHLVKKNLGSGQPTVVSPEQYKRRFLAACRKYFLQCPSHWDHLLPTVQA